MFEKLLKSVIATGLAGFLVSVTGVSEATARTTEIWTTSDHTTYEVLQQEFTSGIEVTAACLTCHVKAARQIHMTNHWTWEVVNPETGQKLGKKNVLNNYCIAAIPNIETCSDCHIGYGWEDRTFDFDSEEAVDCLVCHDTTGFYMKGELPEGHPGIDLAEVAQNVGPTGRRNCGACHFKGGGGEAVKHGDLDPSLETPDGFLDVHMDAQGLDFACSACHAADQHAVRGSRYMPTASDEHGIDIPGRSDLTRASCPSCHGTEPHPEDNHPKLNDHTDRVSCQACHIPLFSRGDYPTKIWWDWSTAGKMDADGQPFHEVNDDGDDIYDSRKGDFRWAFDVVPEYVWFDGRVDYTLPDTPIDPEGIVQINSFSGRADDPSARIWPVKVMRGKQPYDTESKTLVAIMTSGTGGFWTHFDLNKGIQQGMEAVGIPYSGKYGFVETEMFWPINHMVAPVDEAVPCNECHSPEGRLKDLKGFYMPGRDTFDIITWIGGAVVLLTLLGVIVHMITRIAFAVRKR